MIVGNRGRLSASPASSAARRTVDVTVVPRSEVSPRNVWRDFQMLFKRAGVTPYEKPFHSLRKTCITDWAGKFPAHVVKEWAGHADIRTTLKYYLKVSESEYDRAAGLTSEAKPSDAEMDVQATTTEEERKTPPTELPAPVDGTPKGDDGEAGPQDGARPRLTQLWTRLGDSEVENRRKLRAGEGIRTPDVQLGKLAFYH